MKIKPLHLSHSQKSTYQDCQFKWYLQRIKRIRPTYLGSALLVGTAVDNTIEHILLKQEGDYKDTFLRDMNNFQVNKKDKKLPEDILDLKFFVSDLDEALIEQDYMDEICDNLGIDSIEIPDFLEFCKAQRKKKKPLEDTEQSIFNFLAHKSLTEKGLLIIEALREWIEENVAEVHSVQKKSVLENENGDFFYLVHDFTVTLKNGRKVLIDLKTSSDPKKYYPEDAASKSAQLATYYHEEREVDRVAYLVGDKKIRKREPRVRLSFVEGEITEEFLEETFEEIEIFVDEVKEKLYIGEEAFEKNKEACAGYGGCDYCGLCWKNSMDKLEEI